MLQWNVAAGSSVGLVRRENQDAAALSADQRLLVLADGMGGMVGGARAARLAVASVLEVYDAARAKVGASTLLRHAFALAQSRVARTVGSGTTLLAAIVDGDHAVLAHVGDSRAYVSAPGQALQRQTVDHTHPYARNALTRYVGAEAGSAPDVSAFALPPDAVLLLCSDGVWGPVSEHELAAILAPGDAPASSRVASLLAAALRGGAPDNATAVVGQRRRCGRPQ
jgi:serine/threonine protein phosphatase PrpC